MSLVGDLEDMSLGDILQIISLSQKSGVLVVSSDRGVGRIVLRSGAVHGACLKGGPKTLTELLVAALSLDASVVEASQAEAEERGVSVEEILARDAGVPLGGTEEWIRRAVESDVVEMLSWSTGKFSFDARGELEPEDPQFFVADGINAQYLAMEGLRVLDERAREDASGSAEVGAADDPTVEEIFGPLEPARVDGDGPAQESDLETVWLKQGEEEPAEVVVASVLERVAEADPRDPAPLEVLEGKNRVQAQSSPREADREPGQDPTDRPAPARGDSRNRAVVVIDPDLAVLAWVKSAISEDFGRVHVFQKADQGLSRIRQYLIRGENPLVLISPETPVDPLSGIHGFTDFVKRL